MTKIEIPGVGKGLKLARRAPAGSIGPEAGQSRAAIYDLYAERGRTGLGGCR